MNETNASLILEDSKQSKKGKAIMIVIITLIVLLASVAGSLYVGYLLGNNSLVINDFNNAADGVTAITSDNTSYVNTDIATEEVGNTTTQFENYTPEKKAYIGEFISAELPEHWYVYEYIDGAQSSNVDKSIPKDYKGFGGFEIKDGDQLVVFGMYRANPVGGVAYCNQAVKFADTDPEYIKYIEKMSKDMYNDSDPLPTLDLTGPFEDGSYYEYNLFGVIPTRFVDGKMYTAYNMHPTFAGFNAMCFEGMPVQAQTFPITKESKLSWSSEDVNNGEVNYTYTFTDWTNAADMYLIDIVLSSIKVN